MRISSRVRPAATSPTIIPTVTRSPRMQGFPPMTRGSKVILSSVLICRPFHPPRTTEDCMVCNGGPETTSRRTPRPPAAGARRARVFGYRQRHPEPRSSPPLFVGCRISGNRVEATSDERGESRGKTAEGASERGGERVIGGTGERLQSLPTKGMGAEGKKRMVGEERRSRPGYAACSISSASIRERTGPSLLMEMCTTADSSSGRAPRESRLPSSPIATTRS